MSNEINLLEKSERRQKAAGQRKYAKILPTISTVLLIFTVMCSVVLFLLSTASSINDLKQQEKAHIRNLNAYSTLTSKYLLIKERINQINPILSKRLHLDTVISSLEQLLPQNVSLDNASIDKKTISLSLSSFSLLSLNTVIDTVSLKNTDTLRYKTILIDGITYDTTHKSYALSLKIDLNE